MLSLDEDQSSNQSSPSFGLSESKKSLNDALSMIDEYQKSRVKELVPRSDSSTQDIQAMSPNENAKQEPLLTDEGDVCLKKIFAVTHN